MRIQNLTINIWRLIFLIENSIPIQSFEKFMFFDFFNCESFLWALLQ